jgi:hypothetical protein
MSRENARRAQAALAVRWCSFHDSFHGIQARAAEFGTGRSRGAAWLPGDGVAGRAALAGKPVLPMSKAR